MQSHASRHVVSEHLKDRFPLADGGAFQQGVIPLEIARSYGRRGIPKLVDVLKYFLDPNAPAKPDVALALRVLRDELSNQEKKGQAITYGSCPVLTALLKNEDKEIRKLACEVLASLATFFMGRLSMIQCGTIESLVPAVANTTEEATACLKAIADGRDGAAALLESRAVSNEGIIGVVPNLVRVLEQEDSSGAAVVASLSTIASIATTDAGIYAALRARVLPVVLKLATAPKATAAVRAECSGFVMQLCHHPYGKVQTIETGGIALLAGVLGKDCLAQPIETLLLATGGLMGLSTEIEGKLPIAEATFPQMAQLLAHDHANVSENARTVIKDACDEPAAYAIAKEVLDGDALEAVFSGKPIFPPGAGEFESQEPQVGGMSLTDYAWGS